MAPCYGCESRIIGCHSVCGEYALYRRNIEEHMAMSKNDPIIGYTIEKSIEHRRINERYMRKHARLG